MLPVFCRSVPLCVVVYLIIDCGDSKVAAAFVCGHSAVFLHCYVARRCQDIVHLLYRPNFPSPPFLSFLRQ